MHTIERKVGNDALVRIEGESYETSQNHIGKRVVIRYVPDMRHIYLQNDDGTLKEIFKVNRVENSQIKRQEPLFSQGKDE
ncbi:Mu transposase C-terminal domain-containing protein [[Clostridium] spiroforme]|nr:Mu transposase C-terminal domain-containing protein [Thomasclavelia spiroformis]